MVGRHYLVEIKRVEKLALSVLPPPHHRPLPRITVSTRLNHGPPIASMRVLQQNPIASGTSSRVAAIGRMDVAKAGATTGGVLARPLPPAEPIPMASHCFNRRGESAKLLPQ